MIVLLVILKLILQLIFGKWLNVVFLILFCFVLSTHLWRNGICARKMYEKFIHFPYKNTVWLEACTALILIMYKWYWIFLFKLWIAEPIVFVCIFVRSLPFRTFTHKTTKFQCEMDWRRKYDKLTLALVNLVKIPVLRNIIHSDQH